jgi:hypothetical protein
MQYRGAIVDSAGNPVNGYFGIIDAAGAISAGPTDTEGNAVEVSVSNTNDLLFFGAPGYVETVITQEKFLQQNGIVVIAKQFPFAMVAMILIVAAAAYPYMKKNKVSGIEKKDVFNIFLLAGGVIAFSLIKKILEGIGIWKDDDQKALDNAQSSPTSFWNPNYWKQSQSYSYALTTEQASALADQIYNSFGAFNDDEATVIGIFRTLHTKANLSYIAYVFQQKYGDDLLTFLRGGLWPQDRLSDADVNVINKFVAQLPNF